MKTRWFLAALGLSLCFVWLAQNKAPANTNASMASGNCSANAALLRMDARKSVPLLPMMALHQKQSMRSHLLAIQNMTDALARKDWNALIKASKTIETSPHMKRMCTHMGAGAPGFTKLGLTFHKRADAIAKAAQKKDVFATLKAISHTIQACNQCHANFKQEVVDAKTWQTRTGQNKPTMHHHGKH